MNNSRRKEIKRIIARLVKISADVSAVTDDLATIIEDEEEYQQNVPESLQGSEAFCASEEASESLMAADDELSATNFDDAISFLEEAAQ